MTKQESDILIALSTTAFSSQREVSAYTGHALGLVNKSLSALEAEGYVNMETLTVTLKTRKLLALHKPKQAIILAAGFGMRMVPINLETPKAMLTVNGERLIERIIKQLNKVGIEGSNIHIVVGFMKEKFEYLMDKYGVDLIVNSSYSTHNNIFSLAMATKYIDNCYIIPSDVWCDRNPFSEKELYSWYMVSDEIDDDSDVRVNRKNELVKVSSSQAGNAMVGISYLCGDEASAVKQHIMNLSTNPAYDQRFWEEALYGNNDRMILTAKVVHATDVVEINTYEQLRELDGDSDQLKSDAISTISKVFRCNNTDVVDIRVLKKGMTNRSFLFSVHNTNIKLPVSAGGKKDESADGKYIMRIPGEGTNQMINRAEEADVYKAISGKGLCDDPVYINPTNGYKITKFLDGVRNCDPYNEQDLERCMKKLRTFHNMKLKVNHTFDIFGKIAYYESLWLKPESMYDDYKETKENILKLKEYIDKIPKDYCLTHIDAVCDNFLFYQDEEGEKLQLTDWEYSGMQDPHVDIAMFCIYALYNKEQIDHLINLYFAGDDGSGKCTEEVRTKIYCYIAACGFLWSNWCEYKSQLGIEFGEYSLRQYRFAKDFYRYATERMN